LEFALADLSLFQDLAGKTQPARTLAIPDVPAAIQSASPAFTYASRGDLAPTDDVRRADRYLRWELTPVDFGHGVHASLSAAKAPALAAAIANKTSPSPATSPATSRVEPPYPPTIKTLRVAYATAVEIDPAAAPTEHQILHVHPFGACPIDAELPSFLPR